ncbi:MAG: hypothetical protein COA79_12295 [Planctomycetota bacterium]|nr:MAG: hypothetical protein COA79_12295 [Planctomycetota bacterium]
MLKVVSGSARGLRLFDVNKSTTRPITSRIKTSLFDMIQPFFIGEPVADLYSGTGSMGIEALSRGATQCDFVDADPDCVEVINKNLEKTNLVKNTSVINSSVSEFLKNLSNEKYKIVFYDPPFPLVKKSYSHLQKEMQKLLPFIDVDGAIVFRHPKRLFEDVDGFEVVNQREFGVSEVTLLSPKV